MEAFEEVGAPLALREQWLKFDNRKIHGEFSGRVALQVRDMKRLPPEGRSENHRLF